MGIGEDVNSAETLTTPVKAGRESRMQEPHKRPAANHLGPELSGGSLRREGQFVLKIVVGCGRDRWRAIIVRP